MRFRRPPLVLWRYIVAEILTILIVALVAQVLMNVGIVAFQLVQQEGLRLAYVWPLLFKVSALSLYYTVPISLLFAVTLGMGRLVADLEVTALRSSGVSYAQMLAPALLLALACTAVSQYLNGEVIPPIRFERRNLKEIFLRQLHNLGYGGERTIRLPKEMGEISCKRYHGNVLEEVLISVWNLRRLAGEDEEGEPVSQELPVTIRARRAQVETVTEPDGEVNLVVELEDADISVPDDVLRGGEGDSRFLQRIGVGRYRLPISLSDASPRDKDKRSSLLRTELEEDVRNLAVLRERWSDEKDLDARTELEGAIAAVGGSVQGIRAELARRSAFALSCLTFLWVGVPLTLWLNSRNRLVPFFTGNVAAVGIFFPLVTFGQVLTKRGFPPLLALQSGNLILFLVGSVLLWRLRKT